MRANKLDLVEQFPAREADEMFAADFTKHDTAG
jgi:hypothetical protein